MVERRKDGMKQVKGKQLRIVGEGFKKEGSGLMEKGGGGEKEKKKMILRRDQ